MPPAELPPPRGLSPEQLLGTSLGCETPMGLGSLGDDSFGKTQGEFWSIAPLSAENSCKSSTERHLWCKTDRKTQLLHKQLEISEGNTKGEVEFDFFKSYFRPTHPPQTHLCPQNGQKNGSACPAWFLFAGIQAEIRNLLQEQIFDEKFSEQDCT